AKDENKGAGESMNAKNNSFSNDHVLPKGTGIYEGGIHMRRDLSNAILGRVNKFTSLANLKMALCNEGFVDIKIQYMGEFWIMMEFANKEMIKKFRDNLSVGSWFSIVKDATLDFQTKKRIAWVETEGIPFKLWTGYTFKHIAAKWGELLDVDDQEDSCFHSKRLCIYTKLERSISKEFKIIHHGKIYWIRAKETPGWVSDFAEESDDEDLDEVNSNDDEGELKGNAEYSYDSFNIYSTLNKKVEKGGCDNKSDGSLKYPPGFSPKECNEDNYVHAGADIHFNEDGNALNKSKRAEGITTHAPRTGGSILGLLDEVVKVRQTMGYKMKGCMSNMAEIIKVQGAKERCWGNLIFDYVHSVAVGNSGGILCVWDPNCFCKENVTMSNSFVMVSGVWRSTGQKYMLIAVYAPHDTKDKHMLWNYLQREIMRWKGEVVVMGDFNKVRNKSECFGSVFDVHEANMFNSFIMNSGLVEVNLGGCSFTWCHKSASKMSKMDRFLISDSLVNTCPNINAITLERYLSDHHPILLREAYFDYGPIPFKIFHYWFEMDGFNKMVEDAWKEYPGKESNAIRYFMAKAQYKNDLVSIEDIIDRGDGDDEIDNPNRVKREFFDHFNARFCQLGHKGATIQMEFPKKLLDEEIREIECDVTNDEIKRAVWDCGTYKAPGPDGFTFVNEVQSAFIADRQILDGPFILNEVIQWCKSKHKQALIFKVDFEKAYDSVRWDFLDEVLRKFGFGNKWCKWIQCFLRSSRGSILVNGSPTREFQFGKGLKQGDLLSTFLFILVVESLHLSFQRIVDAGRFYGIKISGGLLNLSHMFYADDAVLLANDVKVILLRLFMSSNVFIRLLGYVLICAGKIMGVHVDGDMVKSDVGKLGCLVLKNPFSNLGSIVGGFPRCVLRELRGIRRQFFNGHESNSKKATWVNWKKALLSKERGGLGVSSLYAMNRGVNSRVGITSCWMSITKETNMLSMKGIDLMQYMRIKVSNGESTAFNISRRGISIDSILCANCDTRVETSRHLFFSCCMAREVMKLIARWWNVLESDFDSYEEWLAWFANVRLPLKNKKTLEGVFYVLWWLLWWFRNKTIFEGKTPKKAMFFDDFKCKSFFGVDIGVTSRSVGTIGLKTKTLLRCNSSTLLVVSSINQPFKKTT
nr:RNA-directed DNA polymerase, eukaryota [Tanacetum cinerariifolium]